MTIKINGKPDVLTTQDCWDLMRAHHDLKLPSDGLGAVCMGVYESRGRPTGSDRNILALECRIIRLERPELAVLCERVLDAIGAPIDTPGDGEQSG
jgi:hypothetical protein